MQQIVLVLLSLLALSSASPRTSTSKRENTREGITFPLHKRSSHGPVRPGLLSAKELASNKAVTDVDGLQATRNALIDKYVEGAAAKRALAEKRAARDAEHKREEERLGKKRAVKDIAMTNHNFDTVYSATLQLGTPPKEFSVLLDTGSSDTWVTASNCNCISVGCTSCAAGASWDPSTSSTYSARGKILAISYGSGTVAGYTGSDVASLGGFSIADQVVGIVNQSAAVLPGSVEGLMGLAFGSIAHAGGTPWWLRVLAGEAGETLDNPTMSFWLSRYIESRDGSDSTQPGGQFTIGGTNSSLYTGDIAYFDVIQPAKWWAINLEAVGRDGLDNVSVDSPSAISLVDSGTTLIAGQDIVVDAVIGSLEGAMKAEAIAAKLRGFYALPCDSNTTVSFTFSGQTYTMSSHDLLYTRIDDLRPNYCLSSLFVYSSADRHSIDFRNPYSPYWIIGAAFLKNVYSVYTLGDSANDGTPAGIQGMGNLGTTAKVGFARLSDVKGEIGMATRASNENDSGSTGSSTAASVTLSLDSSTNLPLGVIPGLTTEVVVVTATNEGAAPGPSAGSNAAVKAVGSASAVAAVSSLLVAGLALL
ncbi:hypothetical protein M408DRAFT_330251 [Serendipita vermifera MAFF 305830]|uniref:Peptidase A1 domain-containing protein n=1 Tax=Serendipita vermifera MAFF 305830 TaxID=933852 RepID=A0A0C2WLG4_SERVB|nr:hypothetical protein M408DRAFT_330251 [Serendipita vermifera MAFF 305830]